MADTPRTEAGKRLDKRLAGVPRGFALVTDRGTWMADILAIEAEAALDTEAPETLEAAMWAYQFAGALTTVYDFADDDIVPLLDHLSAMAEGRNPSSPWPAVPGSVGRRAASERPHAFRSKYAESGDLPLTFSGACVDCGVAADSHLTRLRGTPE